VMIDEVSVPGIGIRRSLMCGLITLALVMGFRTFQFFPGMLYVQETWYAACFLIVLFVYPFWKMRAGLRFTRLELYLFLLMIADLVLAAWRAQKIFGQPLAYGILSQREIVLIAALPTLANMLRRGTVKLADLESVLLYLAWGTFALYSGVYFLGRPVFPHMAKASLPTLWLVQNQLSNSSRISLSSECSTMQSSESELNAGGIISRRRSCL